MKVSFVKVNNVEKKKPMKLLLSMKKIFQTFFFFAKKLIN